MGHHVQGLVGEKQALNAVSKSSDKVKELEQGLAFLAVHDIDAASFGGSPVIAGFMHLTPRLITVLTSLSHDRAFAYIETEYFGGTGTQGAMAFKNGVVVYGPKVDKIGPINRALEALGVAADPPRDAFDTIGLVRIRHMED